MHCEALLDDFFSAARDNNENIVAHAGKLHFVVVFERCSVVSLSCATLSLPFNDLRGSSRSGIRLSVCTACALRAHCVHIAHAEARILTQEYLSSVTCLLEGRLKGVNTIGLARCPSILLVVVITNSIVEEELSGLGVDSPPSSIGDREPSRDDDHVDFSAVVDVAIPIDDLEHLGSRITLKSTKVLVHVLSVGKSTL